MRDFTIKIEKLPKAFEEYKDEISIKFALWKYIQEKLNECKEVYSIEGIDTTIVEINLGLNSYKNLNKLKQIRKLNDRIEFYNIKLQLEPENDYKWEMEIYKC